MEEQAKEELEILEAQYPNQHEFLKEELKSLIAQLHYNHQHDSQNNHLNTPHNVYFDTQESTNGSRCGVQVLKGRKKKNGESCQIESPKSVMMKHYPKNNKRKDRVDLALERAQDCLKKIRLFKTSLFSSSS